MPFCVGVLFFVAKELPYFRFTASEWLNDDISLESYSHKGAFIDACAYYWSQDCDVTLDKLKKKFSNASGLLNDLIKIGVIKHENRHDKVEIVFLNKQYDLLSEKRKLRQDAGSKGGKAKAMLKQKRSYKDKDNNKDKDNDKIEVIQSVFLTEEEIGKAGEFFGHHYQLALETLSNYKMSSGKKYKSDYHTLRGWVAKEVNKQAPEKGKIEKTIEAGQKAVEYFLNRKHE